VKAYVQTVLRLNVRLEKLVVGLDLHFQKVRYLEDRW
jgi:hypothetical protein